MSFHADTAADLLSTAAFPTLDGRPNSAAIEVAGVHATLALAEAIDTLASTLGNLETHQAHGASDPSGHLRNQRNDEIPSSRSSPRRAP